MDGNRWSRVDRIFEEAILLPSDERESFLRRECQGDEELHAEIRSLLIHDDGTPADFMVTAARDDPSNAVTDFDTLIDASIGRYRIEGLLAKGGMGTVYLARQDHPARPVALKIMTLGFFSRATVRRFEFEVQTLARLRHPNIAQIYDAGTEEIEGFGSRRIPYFAMEFVPDARTLTEYAIATKLSLERRLKLFLQVCDAVHYGHQQGVIHRDLKPANVLVDVAEHVKVIDFGVARSTDADLAFTTMRTDFGQLIGTLRYMSPEQCLADSQGIDIRSDVYSLGVVLYELLTDRMPYDLTNATIHAAARIICEQAPTNPRTFDRRLRGNLETLVLKAIEKDRDRRYQSVAQLGDEVGRHLRGEPIDARPPTVWVRSLRWTARHPIVATTMICIGLAASIVGGTAMSISYWRNQVNHLELLKAPGSKPWHFAGYAAQLISNSGENLKEWRGDDPAAIVGAELVPKEDTAQRRSLALIGFGAGYPSTDRGALCAFDPNDAELPQWTIRIDPGDLLPGSTDNDVTHDKWSLARFQVIDVFPNRPGKEIVCVFSCEYSSRIIRIYGFDQSRLYELWHRGACEEFVWLPTIRTLVFSGNNGVEAMRRGMTYSGRSHPLVIFAIRPEEGRTVHDFLSERVGERDVDPVFYKTLLPDRVQGMVEALNIYDPSSGGLDGESHIRINANFRDGPATGIVWDIDEYGNEVPGSRRSSEDYGQYLSRYPIGNPKRLPEPASVVLGPLPPIICTNGVMSSKGPVHDE